MNSTKNLTLDWSLEDPSQRTQYIQKLLSDTAADENASSLLLMADYILWADKRQTNTDKYELYASTNQWAASSQKQKCESLDALVESPVFNESQLLTLAAPAPKINKTTFSRSECRRNCPPSLLPEFEDLWYQIDKLDAAIEYYELSVNKRTELRAPLLTRLSQSDLAAAAQQSKDWTSRQYDSQRHFLVDLRTQQYVLRDTYIIQHRANPINMPLTFEAPIPDWDSEIEVRPLGTNDQSQLSQIVFRDELWTKGYKAFNSNELDLISNWLWGNQQQWDTNLESKGHELYFDFRNKDHVYQLLNELNELDEDSITADYDSNLPQLVATCHYYIEHADLDNILRDILDLKLKHTRNFDIAATINQKYGKNYGDNYISTLFTQKIVLKIVEAAQRHLELIQNLFFREEFKTCICCGRTLLRRPWNFTKKSRANDGFMPRCKMCGKRKKD